MTDHGQAAPGLGFGEKVVVLVGGILAAMALTVIKPVLPDIEKELARSATDAMLVKQLFGAVTLAMVAGAPLGGFLVARLGMRRLILVASLVYAIAGTAGLYLDSLPMLLVSRMFVGASAACIQVMSLTLVNTKLDAEGRAKWMGLHVSIAIFCSLVIFPLAGILGDVSWRLPFALYTFGLVVFAALLFSRGGEEAQSPQAGGAEQLAEDERSIWTWMPWHYVLLSLFIGAITFLPTIYLPYQFKEQAGLSPSGIAMILMGTALVSGILAMLYGKARRYLSIHAVFLFSFGAAAAGMAIVAFASNLPAVLVGVVVYSLGNSWFVPNVMTSLGGKLAIHQQARAVGIVKAGHFLSTPLCVLAVEPYARQFGPVSIMLMVSVAAFAIFLLMLVRTVQLGRGGPQLQPQS